MPAKAFLPRLPITCWVLGFAFFITSWVAAEPPESSDPENLLASSELDQWEFRIGQETKSIGDSWKIRDNVLHGTGRPRGYLVTKNDYENFELTLEWRWPDKTPGTANSGVLIQAKPSEPGFRTKPLSIEIQLAAGKAGDLYLIGNGIGYLGEGPFLKARGVPLVRINRTQDPQEKPLGEWNQMTIRSVDRTLEIRVNGVVVNRGEKVRPTRGHIALQAEGAPIAFRNVEVRPVP